MKTFRKSVSILLALILVLSVFTIIPITAHAAEGDTVTKTVHKWVKGVNFTADGNSGLYRFDDLYSNLIFVRIKKGKAGSWDNQVDGNQTGNLTLPTNADTYYLRDWSGSTMNGQWYDYDNLYGSIFLDANKSDFAHTAVDWYAYTWQSFTLTEHEESEATYFADGYTQTCYQAGSRYFTAEGEGESIKFTQVPAADVVIPKLSRDVTVDYIDSAGTEQTGVAATRICGDETALTAGLYALCDDESFSDRVTCSGNVGLVLCDDCTMTLSKGIEVGSGSTLTIYGQSQNTGALTVTGTGGDYKAGIGGGPTDCGDVTINGGVITATGSDRGAAIGSGGTVSGGTVTINGGSVTATNYNYGAGIGGCYSGNATVVINGGVISATGIGSGLGADGSTVSLGWNKITDSITSGSYLGTVTFADKMTDGTTTYDVGEWSDNEALADKTLYHAHTYGLPAWTWVGVESATAAFSCTECDDEQELSATITSAVTTPSTYLETGIRTYTASVIYGGTKYMNSKTATEPKLPRDVHISYIGSDGETHETDAIRICGDETTLSSSTWYAVAHNVTLDGRLACSGNVRIVLCDGYTLTVTEGIRAYTNNGLYVYGQSAGTGTLTIQGSDSEVYNSPLGGNQNEYGMVEINGGTVNVTGAVSHAAAVGGGYCGNGRVTINGGTLNVNSTGMGAAIGGGYSRNGYVTINGGTVNVTANCDGAAIGSGYMSGASDITINGGNVSASNTGTGAAIGGPAIDTSSSITLGWTDISDSIYASKYTGSVTISDPFISGSEMYSGAISDNAQINGKTLIPCEPFSKHSLTLRGDIGVNFFMSLPSSVADGAVVNFECDGVESSYTIDAARDYDSELGLYRASCNVAAKQMTSTVTATLHAFGTTFTDTYTVKEYADKLLTDADTIAAYKAKETAAGRDGDARYAQLSELVKAMLTYGAAAQEYFDTNLNSLANAGISGYTYTPITSYELSDYALTYGSGDYTPLTYTDMSAYGMDYYGTSLTLEGMTEYNIFYWYRSYVPMNVTAVSGSETYTVRRAVVGSTDDPENGDFVRFDICDIPAAKLTDDILLTYTPTDGSLSAQSFTVNPASYIYEALKLADEYASSYQVVAELEDVATSIYNYNQAAKAYFI